MQLCIEFTKPKRWKPISYMIQMATRVPYSHVRLRWVNSVGVDIVYEASGSQVKFIGPKGQKTHPVDIVHSYYIDLDREQYRELVRVCMEYAGVQYGLLQLVGMALVRVFKLKKNPFSRGDYSQVCSEIVGRVLEEILNMDTGLDFDVAGPKELKECLDELLRGILR